MEASDKASRSSDLRNPVIWESDRPHWHSLMFEGDRRVDMIHVFPKDVKKMLVQQGKVSLLEEVGSKARVLKN